MCPARLLHLLHFKNFSKTLLAVEFVQSGVEGTVRVAGCIQRCVLQGGNRWLFLCGVVASVCAIAMLIVAGLGMWMLVRMVGRSNFVTCWYGSRFGSFHFSN